LPSGFAGSEAIDPRYGKAPAISVAATL